MSNRTFPNGDSLLGQIGALVEEINGATKTAATKKAEGGEDELGRSGSASKDPGGYMGASSHPSAKADGNLHQTPLGARARENEADVKESYPGPNVQNVGAPTTE